MIEISKFSKKDAIVVSFVYILVSVLLVSIFALSFKKWEFAHWSNLLIIVPFSVSMFISFFFQRPYSLLRALLLIVATGAIALGLPLYMRNNFLGNITTNDILGIVVFGDIFIAVFASWVMNIVFVVKRKR